ncbi:MAG: hypothetical protein FWF52_09125 [Candidatus Azobacteroides sp.]|nr:hypothetical protein [Candidatus Azobacteroides sp.]
MNKYLFLLLVPLFFLTACRTEKTTAIKKTEQKSYLQFIQNQRKYSGVVHVYIDDKTPFKARVDRMRKTGTRTKGNIYTVKSGAHHLKIVYKKKVVFERNVVLIPQQTREIHLP